MTVYSPILYTIKVQCMFENGGGKEFVARDPTSLRQASVPAFVRYRSLQW